jgi:hypothetical protein
MQSEPAAHVPTASNGPTPTQLDDLVRCVRPRRNCCIDSWLLPSLAVKTALALPTKRDSHDGC